MARLFRTTIYIYNENGWMWTFSPPTTTCILRFINVFTLLLRLILDLHNWCCILVSCYSLCFMNLMASMHAALKPLHVIWHTSTSHTSKATMAFDSSHQYPFYYHVCTTLKFILAKCSVLRFRKFTAYFYVVILLRNPFFFSFTSSSMTITLVQHVLCHVCLLFQLGF